MVRGFLFALCWFLPSIASAQYRGVSAFAAMHPNYPCDALLATTDFARYPAIAVLYETFGYDQKCIARFVARNHWRPHMIDFHFSNEACRRNHNCIDESLGGSVSEYNKALEAKDPKLVAKLQARMWVIRSIFDSIKNDNTRVVISVGLEDNYSDKAFKNLVEILRPIWPWEFSRNPCKGGRSLSGVQLKEFHSLTSRPGGLRCMANEDGNYNQSKKDSQKFLKRYAACDAVFLWREEHQGRTENGKRVPPRKRKFIFTAKDVVELGGLIK